MVTLVEGEWSYRGGQFYGRGGHFKGVLQWRESGHVMEVVSLRGHVMEMSNIKKGEWSC